ncbi:hypothetical protein QBC35DRAFT_546309 [Podospora australis]|uniref:ubiquitinyl hydrolase 1 n=1 Tax=Podospora australis TaxID=1536484 RepID=A0AAN7AE70_9PEZI|nr:hypothetical protein QBC35DRAFT_546309 [Podospora australis]
MCAASLHNGHGLHGNEGSLEYMINHVFLPPRLPQQEDTNIDHEHQLIRSFCASLQDFWTWQPDDESRLSGAFRMLSRLLQVEPGLHGSEKQNTVENILRDLTDGETALFHVREQNAGFLLTGKPDYILVEAFELLATNKDVMSCIGRLKRQFPDCAVKLPRKIFADPDFLNKFAELICNLELNSISVSRPKSKKAGETLDEERDTASPMLITNMLIGILSGLGEIVAPDRIHKNSREQISWANAKSPFHRSATWMLLRVALRLVLHAESQQTGLPSLYRPVMVFFHAQLLGQAVSPAFSSDLRFSMIAKICRRINKLNPPDCTPWIKHVSAILESSHKNLQTKWVGIQNQETLKHDNTSLADLPFDQDTRLRMKRLGKHLEWIETRSHTAFLGAGPGDDTKLSRVLRRELPHLPTQWSEVPENPLMTRFALLLFEKWIAECLSSWTDKQLSQNQGDAARAREGMKRLQEIIRDYHSRARTAYQKIPEGFSVMYLVIMELWVCVDRLAGDIYPLLLEYDPGFTHDMLHGLLLPTKEQMTRLRNVETYLQTRRARQTSYPHVFSKFGTKSSFPARFYDSSAKHQALRDMIINRAKQARRDKVEEYRQKVEEHADLRRRCRGLECDKLFNDWNGMYECRGLSWCDSCRLTQEAEAITIRKFEWPLPEDENKSKAVVFELRVPKLIAIWRDVTTDIFYEALGGNQKTEKSGKLWFPQDHSGLSAYSNNPSQVKPGSVVKPFENTHYSDVHITQVKYFEDSPITGIRDEQSLLLSHASVYKYYHAQSGIRSAALFKDPRLPSDCSHAFEKYRFPLNNWIKTTGHTSNEVISHQSYCPQDMTLEEFCAFGHLRSGVRTQWANILCQLTIPSLALNQIPAYFLIMQACTEAGPDDSSELVHRVAHRDTMGEDFGTNMVTALTETFVRVYENWQNDLVVSLLACLATRMLSLTTSSLVSLQMMQFLSCVRETSLDWAHKILDKRAQSRSDDERQDLGQRAVVVSLICMSTFDVASATLESELLCCPKTLSIFVEAAVLARGYHPADPETSDSVLRLLMHRWHGIMFRCANIIKQQVTTKKNDGLNIAIKRVWAGYRSAGVVWQSSHGCQSHILEAAVTISTGRKIDITWNLLTGQFLVNGTPLSRLPPEYEVQPEYQQLFGTHVLDVMPSTFEMMQFSCRVQKGWVVHFSMVDSNLVVQAVRNVDSGTATDGPEVWEFIHSPHLSGDLPASFVQGYAHWKNISTGTIEFRPLSTPWDSSPQNWTMNLDGDHHVLRRENQIVIEPRSQTGMQLARLLRPLELKGHINLILNQAEKTLSVDLPRFGLSFSLSQGESCVRSKDYSGMIIDNNQGINTLVGLQDKLVLRQAGVTMSSIPSRLIVIPRGTPVAQRRHDHVSVRCSDFIGSVIKHDTYRVNSTLGYLEDNGPLSSKLYLCLLHAYTSHCLPDRLTGRTGTEEALRILRSAVVRSFQRLDSASALLLEQIQSLSPQRQFYPDHLQVMETSLWNESLPPLSQHDAFKPLVQDILQHAQDCELTSPPEDTNPKLQQIVADIRESYGNSLLTQRAIIRNSVFRVSEFGAEDHTTSHDLPYHGRHDCDLSSTKSLAVGGIASILLSSSNELFMPPTGTLSQQIEEITGEIIQGSRRVDLRFNVDHFQPPQCILGGLWCGLHLALSCEPSIYRRIFFLSSLVFTSNAKLEVIQALMAIANAQGSFGPSLAPPTEESFDLSKHRSTLPGLFHGVVTPNTFSFCQCPEQFLPRKSWENEGQCSRRRHKAWQQQTAKLSNLFVLNLQNQSNFTWTVATPTGHPYSEYMDVNAIMDQVHTIVDLARRTHAFRDYLELLSAEIEQLPVREKALTQSASCPGISEYPDSPSPTKFVDARGLFLRQAPNTQRPVADKFIDLLAVSKQSDSKETRKADFLERLEGSCCQAYGHQRAYINELRQSSLSVTTVNRRMNPCVTSEDLKLRLDKHLCKCSDQRDAMFQAICTTLNEQHQSIAESISHSVGMFPRVTPVLLLRLLSADHWTDTSTDWRRCIANYGMSLAYIRRAERLVSMRDQHVDLLKELDNAGNHDDDEGDPLKYPDYLLLEVEQGLLIRSVQHQIATKMITPPDRQNCVMQLNMGEGKSSVIAPIVATSLADGNCLVRVIVAKPQSKQMIHTLSNALGRMLNRRIYYLPISRVISLDETGLRSLRDMMEACRLSRGVLLMQPEHICSLKLMGLESTWAGSPNAEEIVQLFRQMESKARDIVDESDEIFSAKSEVIYTMGSQRPVDMSPNRWTLIMEFLDLLKDTAISLKSDIDPDCPRLLVETGDSSGAFPTIRILDDSVGEQLIQKIADRICGSGGMLTALPVHHQPSPMRQAARGYILDYQVNEQYINMVEDPKSGLFGEPTTKSAMLLLRGLLADGVISFALKKRFRVNYGLALNRRPQTRLAVPYRAKDSPAPRSEFSHTDIVIVLTCLSYYYQGLTDHELLECLEMLSQSEQANEEYNRWSQASQLPRSLKDFSAVNLKDKTLCKTEIFPALRFSKPVIDYYLSHFVFPKEMREFPFKLSSSGWDLAKIKPSPLTGFSGTNDSKSVLPLDVKALDLPEQKHTNALVIEFLLRLENDVLELGNDQPSQPALTVDGLLSAAVSDTTRSVRVILDVGAQIIALGNEQLAKRWLDLTRPEDADAVIFVNDSDDLRVLTRDGMTESFYTSPFTTQTERCLVFLDQAHTRGIDLKLPDHYRAAVTLGPGVTKDTLVQACMRMRKLGRGQSVTFYVSREMQKRIRDLLKLDSSQPLTVVDVLIFSISETWADAQKSVPLWALQGIRHQYQEMVWQSGHAALSREDLGKYYLEDEAQSLEDRYLPNGSTVDARKHCSLVSKLARAAEELEPRQDQISQIREKCAEFGLGNLDTMVALEEEQERELAPEIEQERHTEKPAPLPACNHSMHDDVATFVATGKFRSTSPAFKPAFDALKDSSASELFAATGGFPTDLYITADFARTVQGPTEGYYSDSYQRQVQWVLMKPFGEGSCHMVVVSQWEAGHIKQMIETSPPTFKLPTLHAYMPRTSLSFGTMEDLTTYTVPSLTPDWTAPPPELIMQLNLFAGQLYLRNYTEYVRLCRYLGLSFTENRGDIQIGVDGFVGRRGGEGYAVCPFEQSPVAFLSALFKRIRRHCMDIEKTHMGRILAGGILSPRDFVDQNENENDAAKRRRPEQAGEDTEEGEDDLGVAGFSGLSLMDGDAPSNSE